MKSLFDWHGAPPHFLCHVTVRVNHQFICVTFVPEMAGWVVLLDLWNHYCTLDISTWSLSQDYKIYTSSTWQLTLHAWVDWGLYEKYALQHWFVWTTMYTKGMLLEQSFTLRQRHLQETSYFHMWKSKFSNNLPHIYLSLKYKTELYFNLLVVFFQRCIFHMVLQTFAGHELNCDHSNHSSTAGLFHCSYPCFPCTLTFYVIVRPHCNCCKWRHKGCTDGY